MRVSAPWVLLALLAVLPPGGCAVTSTAAAGGDTNSTGSSTPPRQLGHLLRVCVADSHPVSSCNTSTNDPGGFSGKRGPGGEVARRVGAPAGRGAASAGDFAACWAPVSWAPHSPHQAWPRLCVPGAIQWTNTPHA